MTLSQALSSTIAGNSIPSSFGGGAGGAGGGGGSSEPFAVEGFSPDLVASFTKQSDNSTEGEYFRKGGADDSFDLFTYGSGSSLRTMFDSTGTLVWAPHNLIPYSEGIGSTGWSQSSGASAAQNATTAPDGENTASRIYGGASDNYCAYKSNTTLTDVGGNYSESFNLSTETWTSDNPELTTSFTGPVDGWYRLRMSGFGETMEVSAKLNGDDNLVARLYFNGANRAVAIATDDLNDADMSAGVFFWGFCCYRSDLGGMADNPDQTVTGLEKYVPTTSAAVYLPRRNAYYYNGTAWTKGGLQLESAAATNLLTYSNDFSNASWIKDGCTVAQDASGIDGSTSAFTLTATGSPAFLRQTLSTAATEHTFSVFVKAGTATVFWLYHSNGNTHGVAYFDLSDESTQAVAGSSQTPTNLIIEKVGDFYRISANWVPGTSSYFWGIGICDAKGSTTATTGITGIISASQLEAGSFPTSYIPTNGSTVTRAAETLSIAGADTPANTTAMSISMKGLMTYADEGAAAQETFLRWYADANNFITLDLDTDSTATGEVNAKQSAAGTLDTVVAGAEYSPGVNVAFNIASRHTSGAINVAKDGTAATADTTPTALADLSSTALTPGYGFNGFVSELRMWDEDITDTGLETATA